MCGTVGNVCLGSHWVVYPPLPRVGDRRGAHATRHYIVDKFKNYIWAAPMSRTNLWVCCHIRLAVIQLFQQRQKLLIVQMCRQLCLVELRIDGLKLIKELELGTQRICKLLQLHARVGGRRQGARMCQQ